jgi:NADPH:quinone reductase-like Zn-dependent oxidoreductase
MRNFAILGQKAKGMLPAGSRVDTVVLDDVPVSCAIVQTPEPQFVPDEPGNECRVLVRVKAFSLNYRDKNRIFSMVVKGAEEGFYVVGSEFVAEVLAVGSRVTEFAPGDRVMGDNNYPGSNGNGAAPGVPTNHASKEIQIFHKAKLLKVPGSMPDATAAAFSIGAQTTYSMIRKLDMPDGANVLVTSAKSNTSLFAINALKNRRVNVYATSTSDRFQQKLEQMGVKQLIAVDAGCANFREHPVLGPLARRLGGFNGVIDPYFDLHLSRVLDVMAMGGKYITCGLYDQYLQMIGKDTPRGYKHDGALTTVMLKNLHIIGNCIGLTRDLQRAAQDFAAGSLEVAVDSVFSGGQIAAFLARTFNAKDRLGKVIYHYD